MQVGKRVVGAGRGAEVRAKRSKYAASATCSALLLDERVALDERIAELVEAVQARDDFIAIAGHELRNPMTPIQAQIELLVDAARRDPGAAALLPRLEKLQRLIGSYVRRTLILLDVACLNAEASPLEAAEVDLSEILREAVAALEPIAQGTGCAIAMSVADRVVGRWDRAALEQVIENLLTNAIKYGAGALIEIALDHEADRARLRVRDHGCGIAAEDQQRIFARFERAVRRRGTGGFGLGLWISHRLICSMGGEIVVESSPNEGACFTVVLPLRSD